MQIAIDEAYLPATLTASPMTDEEFTNFCLEYPDHFVEMSADGEIVIMPPNYTLTGLQSQMINVQLVNWAMQDGTGFATEGTAAFRLLSGARRSPDAAWTRKDRILALTPLSRKTFWHLCPDFVIELRSHADRLPTLRKKMQEWMENGAQLAWLIDPDRRAVEIYRTGNDLLILENPESVAGESPIGGFVLQMKRVWDPLGF